MESLSLTHQDLASNAKRFAGRLVALAGVLMVVGKRSYLILDPEDSKTEVAIEDIGFRDRMLANLGCKVGANYLYRDTASLQGTLTVQRSGQIALRDIVKVCVTRDGETFEF